MDGTALIAAVLLLAGACWTDVRTMRIPNALILPFVFGGLLYHAVFGGVDGLIWTFAGAAAGLVPLYPMFLLRGIGGGDVKWFGAFGIWAGPPATVQLLVYSLLAAGAIASALLLFRLPALRTVLVRMKWPWGNHPAAGARGVRFPFMLAVAPGFMMLLGKG